MKSAELSYGLQQSTRLECVTASDQQIEIYQHPYFGNMLITDDDLQISESDRAYGQALVEPLEQRQQISQVAILGGSDGSVVRELLESAERFNWPLQKVMLLNCDEKLVQLAKYYLKQLNNNIFDDSRVELHYGDVLELLKDQNGLDAVIYDLPMDAAGSEQQYNANMSLILNEVLHALNPGGLLTMQCCGEGVIGPCAGDKNRQRLDNIRNAVDHRFVFRHEWQVVIPSFQERWRFLSASKR